MGEPRKREGGHRRDNRIRPINARIGTLERRLEHLRKRGDDPNRRAASRNFDMAEVGALEEALRALRRYRAEIEIGKDAVEMLEKLRDVLLLCAPAAGTEHDRDEVLEDVEFFLRELRR